LTFGQKVSGYWQWCYVRGRLWLDIFANPDPIYIDGGLGSAEAIIPIASKKYQILGGIRNI
jgi:hypothetical protein